MAYNFSIDWRAPDYFFRGLQFNYWASVLVSLGWVGAVMLVCRCGAPRVTSRLAAVGRTAFANDILQIVICSTLFYGHGFGLFGMLDRLTQAAIVRVVWAFQLTVSPLWMRRFHFGPLEWLWRSLVYLKMQPFE
jgi:uncharacterized protein